MYTLEEATHTPTSSSSDNMSKQQASRHRTRRHFACATECQCP